MVSKQNKNSNKHEINDTHLKLASVLSLVASVVLLIGPNLLAPWPYGNNVYLVAAMGTLSVLILAKVRWARIIILVPMFMLAPLLAFTFFWSIFGPYMALSENIFLKTGFLITSVLMFVVPLMSLYSLTTYLAWAHKEFFHKK